VAGALPRRRARGDPPRAPRRDPRFVAAVLGPARRDAPRPSERIPWVADLRDPWTGYFTKAWPSDAAKRWEEDREAEAMRAADAVIANTPGQRRELLERFPELAPAKFVAIPNGYDADDFRVATAPRPSDEVLVVHTGHVTCDPPGTTKPAPDDYAFDRSTHSLEWLLCAMATLRGRPGAPRVRARLVGKVDAAWVARAEALGLRGQVDFLGYLPHREATSHLLAADLLYLPTVGRRDGRPSANVPAKTYEYVGSGRPVAAMTDAGDVRDLMTGRARCVVLGARDAAGLADLLASIQPGSAPHALPPDPPDAHPWRRDEQARQMANVLKRVAGAD
jgi:glycosyltransferase involved in cell wall biosynthesis